MIDQQIVFNNIIRWALSSKTIEHVDFCEHASIELYVKKYVSLGCSEEVNRNASELERTIENLRSRILAKNDDDDETNPYNPVVAGKD